MVKEKLEDAKYRFKPWTNEDYYNSYLNFQEMEEERLILEE